MSNDVTPGEVQQQPQSPPPPPPTKKDNTIMLVLAYLGILFLIPLLTEKDDPDVQWHAKHGMVLFVAEVIFFIGLFFVLTVLRFIPVVKILVAFLGCFLWPALCLGLAVLHIILIMKATKGERMKIPIVTDYVSKF